MDASLKPAKHSAAGQYLGFALQPVRAFYHLLTSPKGSKVSLELKDDVAIHYPDGRLCLEQIKSALKQNPIADWHIDFWKALNNWISMLCSKEVDPLKTSYRIYVTPAKKGKFAEAMAAAQDTSSAELVLQEIRTKFGRLKNPPACALHLEHFFASPKANQVAIITHFDLDAAAHNPLDSIRTALMPGIAERQRDVLIKSGIGQAKQEYDRLIAYGSPPIIDADEFRKAFHEFIRQNNMPGLLTSLRAAPPVEDVEGVAATRPIFIRQLNLIEIPNEEVLRAVSDYLRASADKADWAEQGDIFSANLESWDDDLVRRHAMIRGEIVDLHADKPATVRGRLVYRRCALHRASLGGRVVPDHFVHGSYNDLADRRRIGWHDDYITLLTEESE